MDDTEKRAISTSLPDIIARVAVNTTFKAAVYSSGLWEDEALDNLMGSSKGKDLLYRLSQSVKKTTLQDAFDVYVKMFRDLGESDAADLLQSEVARYSHVSEALRTRKESENVNLTATSLMDKSAIACSTVSPPPRPPLTQEDWRGLKERIRQTLPPRGERDIGYVAVTPEYYKKVYDFASRDKPHETPPDPLQAFDLRRKMYPNTFCYLPPETCAVISQVIGGTTQRLISASSAGHAVLKTVDGIPRYCRGAILLMPGSVSKCGFWVSMDHSIWEVMRGVVSYDSFSAAYYPTDEEVDLSLPVSRWQPKTTSEYIQIFRTGRSGKAMSLAERRSFIARYMNTASCDDNIERTRMLVTSRHKKRVQAFTSDKTSQEPGPVQEPDVTGAAINFDNIDFLPPECSSILIDFYGGQVTLRSLALNNQRKKPLYDFQGSSVFYPCKLYIGTERGERGSLAGKFFLSKDKTLKEGIGCAIGFYPSCVRAPDSPVDLDLQMSVQKWFQSSSTIVVIVLDRIS